MVRDRIINQHQPGTALYPRNLSYDLLPLIGPAGWSLLRALHDHADEQAIAYRGTRPIAPSHTEMQALAGVGEATLLVVKELLRLCGCLSWEEIRGKQEPRPGRRLKQAPTRSLVYYLHPLNGLEVTAELVERVVEHAATSERTLLYLKANGLFRPQPAFLPTSVWPVVLAGIVETPAWQTVFERLYGLGKVRDYQGAVAAWLSSAAEVVATLELEQQGLRDQPTGAVQNRACIVMTRWGVQATVSSWCRHGGSNATHGDSLFPVNKSTNETTRKGTPGVGDQIGAEEQGLTGGEVRANWNGTGTGPANAIEQNPGIVPGDGHGQNQAEAGMDRWVDIAAAEAALWNRLPQILMPADAGPSSPAHAIPYQPTQSEARQARRLLRRYPLPVIERALQQAIAAYHPKHGQPDTITRWGFAVGMEVFRQALSATGEHGDRAAVSEPPGEPGPQVATESHQIVTDFWHEYERVNGEHPTRAERRRIEAVAAQTDWRQLLIWLDKWERAHDGESTGLSPGYFEACAASKSGDKPWLRVASSETLPDRPAANRPAPASAVSAQEVVYGRLNEQGVKKARNLAGSPGVTLALVDAWIEAAGGATIKNRAAFIASGVASGKWPLQGTFPDPASDTVEAPATPGSAPLRDNTEATQHQMWQHCRRILQERLSPVVYETWIAPCELVDLQSSVAVVGTPNVFVRDELEQCYREPIAAAIAAATGQLRDVLFVIATWRHR